jgi:hypothetical protein
MFYLPERLGPATLERDLTLIVLAVLAISAAPLARQLLAPPLAAIASAAGWACVAVAAVPLVRDAVAAFVPPGAFASAVLRLPAWHPGRLLSAGPHLQSAVIAGVFALTVLLIAAVARASRDAYPELYELSMSRLQRTERLRGRLFASSSAPAAARPHAPSTTAAGAPAGAAIFVWRAWTEYRRTHGARSTALETALLLCSGYAFARLTAAADPEAVAGAAASLANVLFIVALARSAALAGELRRPLFWFGRSTTFARLAALALAQSWRITGWFVLFAVGLGAGGAALATIAAPAFAGPAAWLLAVATGYASYGLLPIDVDQRGPMLFVRWLAGYCMLVPAVAAGIASGVFARSAAAGIVVAAAAALLEAAGLIAFAARRLDRASIPLR